jgi:ubiquinone/menaquinone biosynthesis C-methylase UbiE
MDIKLIMNIADLWEICIRFMWDETFVTGVHKFLKSHNVKTVLDVAGGTGFPCIGLKKMGCDITYSDGSRLMFDHFKSNLEKSGIGMLQHNSNWLELTKQIPERFDALLCRGNSLVYVDSWDQNRLSDVTIENIRKALAEFYKMLNRQGLLYVDITNKKEFNQPQYPVIEEFGEKIIDGKKVKLRWELIHDFKHRLRTWKSILLIDGKRHEFTYLSYLLTHEELIDLLKQVGFRKVKETEIDGEDRYNVFVAYK